MSALDGRRRRWRWRDDDYNDGGVSIWLAWYFFLRKKKIYIIKKWKYKYILPSRKLKVLSETKTRTKTWKREEKQQKF